MACLMSSKLGVGAVKPKMSVLLGIATSALLFAGASYASTGVQMLRAEFDNIGIQLNGRAVALTAQPLIYGGNVYVPISTVAHALGANVRWVNKPAAVIVTAPPPALPLRVFYNGTALQNGITNGKGYADVPATTAAYEHATGLSATVDSAGNVNFTPTAGSALPATETSLLTLKPTSLLGDFANSSLYKNGQLTNQWPATVIGQLYPGASTIEWGVMPGQTSQIPGIYYNLAGQYQTLTGQFAVDDLSKNFNGYVRLVFVGDGNVLNQTPWIQGGAAPTPVSVNVSGVTQLEIQYEVKTADGNVYTTGQRYVAPAKNPDGSTADPIVFTDFLNPALTP